MPLQPSRCGTVEPQREVGGGSGDERRQDLAVSPEAHLPRSSAVVRTLESKVVVKALHKDPACGGALETARTATKRR